MANHVEIVIEIVKTVIEIIKIITKKKLAIWGRVDSLPRTFQR